MIITDHVDMKVNKTNMIIHNKTCILQKSKTPLIPVVFDKSIHLNCYYHMKYWDMHCYQLTTNILPAWHDDIYQLLPAGTADILAVTSLALMTYQLLSTYYG